MKYKRKKMWKSWILFGFIFAMFFLIPTGYAYLKTRDVKTEKDIITEDSDNTDEDSYLPSPEELNLNNEIKKYRI